MAHNDHVTVATNNRITEAGIHADIKRFSQMHSWYKHLPLTGETYYPLFKVGLQPRNGVEKTPVDNGLHVWFTHDKSMVAPDTPGVTFNRFFRGLEQYSGHAHVVGRSDYWKPMLEYINQHYPEIWPAGLKIDDYEERQERLDRVFVIEHDRQVENAHNTVVAYARNQNLFIGVKLV